MIKQFFQAFSIHTVDALTRQWEENYCSLKRFANQHGHCNIARKDRSETGSALGTWIQHQRGLYARGRLLAERIERLEALPGWSWNLTEARWEQNFAALQQFAAKHGHPFPPFSYRSAEGLRLAAWISNQRRTLRKDPLSMKRRARFETLPGWTWTRTDTRWEVAFNELAEHIDRTGELRVRPRTALANWMQRQRSLYHRGDLDAMRARRLAALPGWTWNPLDTGWDDNFAALRDYASRTGRARPAQSYTTDSGFQLGRWVSDQRRRRGKLTEERRKQLEALPGWTWNASEAQWEEFITALRAFAAEHDHAYPPRDPTRPELVKLNQAVVSVRRPARRNRLSVEQRRQLEELPGWSWEYRQKSTWETSFAALVAYAAQHGHATPPKDYCTPDGIALGLWVHEMRQPSRRRKLGARQSARLEALPGWTW